MKNKENRIRVDVRNFQGVLKGEGIERGRGVKKIMCVDGVRGC